MQALLPIGIITKAITIYGHCFEIEEWCPLIRTYVEIDLLFLVRSRGYTDKELTFGFILDITARTGYAEIIKIRIFKS